MLFLATGTVANGMHALEPTTPIFRLVEAENQLEARVKFVDAVKQEIGREKHLLSRTIQVNGVIT